MGIDSVSGNTLPVRGAAPVSVVTIVAEKEARRKVEMRIFLRFSKKRAPLING